MTWSTDFLRQTPSAEDEAAELRAWIEELSELQLRHYLIHRDDVRSCPNNACHYSGTVVIDADTDQIECTAPLQCPECLTKW